MGTIEEYPLLSANDSDEEIEENLSDKNNSFVANKLRLLVGLLAALGWVSFSAFSAIFVQLIERRTPDFELNGLRMSLAWMGSVVILLVSRRIPLIPREYLLWTIPTVIIQNGASLVTFIGVTYISLSSFHCTTTTVCLATGVIIHRFVNNDGFHVTKLLAICMCTIGVLFVNQPDFLFHVLGLEKNGDSVIYHSANQSLNQSSNQSSNMHPQKYQCVFNQSLNATGYMDSNVTSMQGTPSEIVGYILAIVCGVVISLNIALNRKLTSSDGFQKHYVSYLFWVFTFGLSISCILMLIFESVTLPQSVADLLYILGHAVSYALVLPCLLYATSSISGQTLSIMSSLQTIIMVAAQYSVLREILPGHRNWEELFGVFLVICGSILPSMYDVIKKDT